MDLVRNRRALSDIGNLVGALSARCTVSKVDGSSQNTKEYDPTDLPTLNYKHKALTEAPALYLRFTYLFFSFQKS